jgi:sporulation protein YlmC with PRC-barrel domain
MKFQTMTAVSALALMMSFPAYAADGSANDVSSEAGSSSLVAKDNSAMDSVKSGLTKADASMRDTADDIKAFFVGKDADARVEPVLIQKSKTAHGLLGETIVNTKGKKIATVKDIIIDKSGKATLVVVSDGGLLGIGDKVAAFNYNKVIEQKPDGKVVMTLSQEMVDHAKEFSYDQKDWAKAKVIPAGSVSVNELLKGDVIDDNGKKVAAIENVYLRDADVSQIIVGFNKTLGMGGDFAALDYDDLQMVRKDGALDFKLTANQAAQFKNFKASVAN